MRNILLATVLAIAACSKPVKVTKEDELAVLSAIIHENCYKKVVDKPACLRLIYAEQRMLKSLMCDPSMDPLCSRKQ